MSGSVKATISVLISYESADWLLCREDIAYYSHCIVPFLFHYRYFATPLRIVMVFIFLLLKTTAMVRVLLSYKIGFCLPIPQ